MIPTPRKRKFDPNQGSIPGFNMGGTERMPSAPSTGPSVAPGTAPSGYAAAGSHPSAADAYSAAEGELTAPRAAAPRAPGLPSPNTPAGGLIHHALSAAGSGASPLAAMGPYGAAIDMGLRGVKAAFKPNPYKNPDTWRMENSSDEGQNLWMGRGMDKPGLYQVQTAKKYFGSQGRQESRTFPSEYKETYQGAGGFSHPGDESMGGMTSMSPGMASAPAGLAPPGPAHDYMHMSRTSGSGGPFFTAHENATNGFNTAGVEPIRAPNDD